ncbi:FtsW/RodA/SpoVE family cell cycle protein [Sulfurimonas sp. HSL3-7]|uniref:FtsW/RodA/SpoVE family cell cycle protein n=1 Tax=Sulfonitrofixus jiaomeiensis TaxID=3131938 RepID=UPI0031F7C165
MADRQLFILTSLLIGISIIFTYSLSSYVVVLFDYSDFHFVIRQFAFGLLSILIMWSLAQLNPDIWLARLGFALFFGALFLMIAMPFMPASLVSEVGGAKRWIKVAGFSLAPVEFFKIGFVYFLAWSFSRKMGHHGGMGLKEEFSRFAPYAVFFVVVMVLIAVLQKDLGQVVVLSMALLFMLMFAGSSFKFFITLLGSASAFFLIFIFTAEHRIMRIKSWWSLAQNQILAFFPESIASKLRIESYSEPYQISHSLNAIHNGGLFGSGLANGTFKLGFLSEVHTDFVLAGIAEEFGFLGVLLVTIIFLAILQRIFRVANRTQDEKSYLFSMGIGLLIAFTFLINAYGISGLTPIKGISVPFLSYGGSAMIAASVGIGMVLMASRKVKLKR